jgi:thiosulfate/3-mercaptopyruvate sulfurtransferase
MRAAGAESAEPAYTRFTSSKWVIDVAVARELVDGGAIVFDARKPDLKRARPLSNAVSVAWQDFTNEDATTKGRLLGDDALLTKRLQTLGVSKSVAVLVLADAKLGGGEDGRLAWTLRTLGHPSVFLVDGGIDAFTRGGLPGIKPPPMLGDFVVSRDRRFEIMKEELRASLGKPGIVILDVRELREYAGETPYGESRGGHVPGAKHFFYRDLLDANGNVLSREQIRAKLSEIGVKDDSEVASYCTGGVRAAFATAVLNDVGIKAKNYAGSMWEWSASPADQYPLV